MAQPHSRTLICSYPGCGATASPKWLIESGLNWVEPHQVEFGRRILCSVCGNKFLAFIANSRSSSSATTGNVRMQQASPTHAAASTRATAVNGTGDDVLQAHTNATPSTDSATVNPSQREAASSKTLVAVPKMISPHSQTEGNTTESERSSKLFKMHTEPSGTIEPSSLTEPIDGMLTGESSPLRQSPITRETEIDSRANGQRHTVGTRTAVKEDISNDSTLLRSPNAPKLRSLSKKLQIGYHKPDEDPWSFDNPHAIAPAQPRIGRAPRQVRACYKCKSRDTTSWYHKSGESFTTERAPFEDVMCSNCHTEELESKKREEKMLRRAVSNSLSDDWERSTKTISMEPPHSKTSKSVKARKLENRSVTSSGMKRKLTTDDNSQMSATRQKLTYGNATATDTDDDDAEDWDAQDTRKLNAIKGHTNGTARPPTSVKKQVLSQSQSTKGITSPLPIGQISEESNATPVKAESKPKVKSKPASKTVARPTTESPTAVQASSLAAPQVMNSTEVTGGRYNRLRRRCAGAIECSGIGTTWWHSQDGQRFTAAAAPSNIPLYCDTHAPKTRVPKVSSHSRAKPTNTHEDDDDDVATI